MGLRTVHQVLIAAAGGLGVLFGLRSLWMFAHGGGVGALAVACASVAFAVAMGGYLRHFRRKLASAPPRDGGSATP